MMSPGVRFHWENAGNHTEMDTNRAVTKSMEIQDTRDLYLKEQHFYFSVLQKSDGLQGLRKHIYLAILHLEVIFRYKSRRQRLTKIIIPAFKLSLPLFFSYPERQSRGNTHFGRHTGSHTKTMNSQLTCK